MTEEVEKCGKLGRSSNYSGLLKTIKLNQNQTTVLFPPVVILAQIIHNISALTALPLGGCLLLGTPQQIWALQSNLIQEVWGA